jgi:uncharacterized membrane protein
MKFFPWLLFLIIACRLGEPAAFSVPVIVIRETAASAKQERALSSREDAHLRGVRFRAGGTEGDWILEVSEDGISFTDNVYGRAFVPSTIPEYAEGATIYVSTTETHRLQLIIEQRECVSPIDGERFELTVEVNLDGDGYHGCGYTP